MWQPPNAFSTLGMHANVALHVRVLIVDLSSKLGVGISDLTTAGYSLIAIDFNLALSQARASFSASIGAPSIPKVSWDDVGGLASVKSDILDTIQLPLQHPELFSDGVKKRSGTNYFLSESIILEFRRHTLVWAAWNRENLARQSGSNFFFPQLLLHQGSRTTEYVYRRV